MKSKGVYLSTAIAIIAVLCLGAAAPWVNLTVFESGVLRASGTNLFAANSNLLRQAISAQPPSSVLSNLATLGGASGDILIHNGTTWIRLAKGTAGQIPTYTASGITVSNVPVSSAQPPSAVLSNLAVLGGATGDLLIHNGTNWVRLAKGTAGQIPTYTASGLTVSNLPVTPAQPPSSVLSNLSGLGGAVGDLLIHDGTNWVRLAKGTPGQIPTYTASGIVASNPPISQITTNNLPAEVLLEHEGISQYGRLLSGITNLWNSYQRFVAGVGFDAPIDFGVGTFGSITVTQMLVPRVSYGVSWSTTGQSNAVAAGDVYAEIELRAPKASPGFTGNPTAPTPSLGDADSSIATTEFTSNAIATATAPTGVAAGTYPLSTFGNTLSIDSRGRATSVDLVDFENDFDIIDEFVGPNSTGGATFWQVTPNGGTFGNGTFALTTTNLFGMGWIATSGVNQYPISILPAAFFNSGMSYAQVTGRLRLPVLSDNTELFEWQFGIFDIGTTTNRPKAGAWITSNTQLGNGNVWLVNGTNSTYSFLDTGIAMSAATWSQWAVRLTPSNSIAFYGGTPVATNSASYPINTFLPYWGSRLSRYFQTAAATRYLYFDRCRARFRAGPGR